MLLEESFILGRQLVQFTVHPVGDEELHLEVVKDGVTGLKSRCMFGVERLPILV